MAQPSLDRSESTSRLQLRDLERRIEQTPEDWVAKGMYFSSIYDTMAHRGVKRQAPRTYYPFRDYPLRDFMRLLIEAASELYPKTEPKEAMRLLGQLAFPTLMRSTVGKVIFSVAGRSWMGALQLTQQAYNVSVSGAVELVRDSETSVTLRIREVWNYPDCYHVGVFEGAMRSYKIEGSIAVHRQWRPCDVDLVLSWRLPGDP